MSENAINPSPRTAAMAATVAGVPCEVRITDGELRIRVGRYDPADAGELSIDPRSGTASLLVAVAGPDGNSAGPGLRKYFDLYARPRAADGSSGSTEAEPAEGADGDAAGTPGRDRATVETNVAVHDLLTLGQEPARLPGSGTRKVRLGDPAARLHAFDTSVIDAQLSYDGVTFVYDEAGNRVAAVVPVAVADFAIRHGALR